MKDRWLKEEDYLLGLFVIFVIAFSIIIVIKINHPELEKNVDIINESNVVEQPKIIINEVSIYPKEAIELYNDSEMDVNLNGYSISDKKGRVYSLNNKVISKKGYLVITSDDLGFDINNSNEVLYLKNHQDLVNSFSVNKLIGDISTGISNGNKVYYKNITLGDVNSNIVYFGFSETPSFNIDGGYANVGTKVELSTMDGSTIYYTTDGKFPTLDSNVYSGPITITKNTVIKAMSYKNGYLESDIVSRTFITTRTHDIAFVSISTDNMNFYENYQNKEEQKMNFEFYESDGSYGISFVGDVKVSGWGSSGLPQKNLSVYLRKKYSSNKVTYPFFSNISYNTYSSLMLKNAGTDPNLLHIKEGLLNTVIKGEIELDTRDYRPVVVYLNGEYWGIYSLMQKLNGDYLETKYQMDKKKVDFFKYYVNVFKQSRHRQERKIVRGTDKAFNELLNYLNTHDVTDTNVYNYLKSQIDVSNLIDYWIVEAFFGNIDYPYNNVRMYKEPDGKWKWMLYDLDYCSFSESLDAFLFLTTDNNIDWVKIIKKLKDNSEFRDLYLTSLGTTFKPERVNKIIDENVKIIEGEMFYHLMKWGTSNKDSESVSIWKNNIASFKNNYAKRYNHIVSSLKTGFNLSDSEYNKYFGGLS